MRGPTSGFLDRVHRDAPTDDRSRLAGEVRLVFFSLMASMDADEAERWVEELPRELETLWKPAHLELIRSRAQSGDEPGADETRASRPVEVLRRRLPDDRRDAAERLMRAVLVALGERSDRRERESVARQLPKELSGLVTSASG